MPLPGSINTNYVAGVTQVRAADLVDMQEQIVALADGEWETLQTFLEGAECAEDESFEVSGDGRYKHGPIPWQMSPYGGTETVAGAFLAANGCIVASGGSGVASYMKPLDFERGRRITELQVRVGKSDTEHWTASLIEATDGSEDTIDSDTSTEGTGTGLETLVLTPPGAGLVVVEFRAYYLKLTRTGPSLDLRFYRGIPRVEQP